MVTMSSSKRLSPHFRVLLVFVNVLPWIWSGESSSTQECCRGLGVDDSECVNAFCDVQNPPTSSQDYENLLEFERQWTRCRQHLPAISQCLADGRNTTTCCRRSRDADNDACFDMCEGRAKWDENWENEQSLYYKSCITFNLDDIYRCYSDGYTHSPSAPQDVEVSVLSPTRAEVRWSAPGVNAHLVDQYVVHVRTKIMHFATTVLTKTTSETRLDLSDLRPDTKYNLRVTAVAADGEHRSLPTRGTVFVTNGVSPQLLPYRTRVEAALNTDETLVCRVEVPGWQHKHVQLLWEKKNAVSGKYELLHNRDGGVYKYDLTAYVAARHRQPRVYVSALRIIHVSLRDFGNYQCTATNAFGKGVAQVQLAPVMASTVPASPPNTTECCVRAGVNAECLPSCRDSNSTLPSQTCILDAPKILGCSVSGTDRGACCLRRKVPSHCLSFCDDSVSDSTSTPNVRAAAVSRFSCLMHTTDIFACILEASRNLPEAPTGVRVAAQTSHVAIVRWEASSRASRYHVYWRTWPSHGAWRRTSVVGTDAQLDDLVENEVIEVIVVAANDSGRSGSSRSVRVYSGRSQRDLPMPFDGDDVSRQFRVQQRLRGAATGRLMEEHFDST